MSQTVAVDVESVRNTVREKYGQAAIAVMESKDSGCCGCYQF